MLFPQRELQHRPFNVSKMRQLDLVEQFAEVFGKERDASKPGNSATLRKKTVRTMHGTALSTFGKRSLKAHGWLKSSRPR